SPRRARAAALSLSAAAARKTELLSEYAGFHRSLKDGFPDVLLVPGERPEALDALASALLVQGIEVERASRTFDAKATPHGGFESRKEFPVGTLRIRSSQPAGRLGMTLLQPETLHPESGMDQTYDITAWSLPYAFGVEAHTTEQSDPDGGFQPLSEFPIPSAASRPANERPIGWLIPPTMESSGPLYRWLADGGGAVALDGAFVLDGKSWPAGTRLLHADPKAEERLAGSGLEPLVVPVTTGMTEEGRDLGTPWSLRMKASRVGVFRGPGIWPTSFGAAWYFLEQVTGIPFDALDLAGLSGLDLATWDVLVLPDGSPGRVLRDRDTQALEAWIRAGGTLVASAGSARWASGVFTDIMARSSDSDSLSAEARRERALRTRDEKRLDRWEESVNGVILPVRTDPEHPLAWGAGLGNRAGMEFVLHIQDLSFEPADEFETVVSFDAGLQAVSGLMSDAKLEELSASSWLVSAGVGQGRVILFADDPLFRLMWPSQFILFLNALLLGPAM
ncbi:MAG: hypothetical protein ACWGON_10675, partial [Gemmatimonadota bacterium]